MKAHQYVMSAIAIIVVLSFCLFAVYIGFRQTPQANQHFIDLSLGALIAQFTTVISFYFGSSRSAEKKDQDLQNPKS